MKKTFFSKVLSLIICAVTVCSAATVLSSCGEKTQNAESGKTGGEQIVILSLGDYFDTTVFETFEDETGCKVKLEELSTNEEIYAKFSTSNNKYDVICISDYMIEHLMKENKLQEIDFSTFENYKNIDSNYIEKSKAFDPDSKYTVPHFFGTTGLLYNKKKVDAKDIKSWNVLWNEKYSGRIIMMNSIRDAFIPALEILGYSLNTTDKKQLDEAKELLIKQAPLAQSYLVDEARDEVIAGNADIAMAYSGEAYIAQDENENLEYIVPDEGSNFWIDSLCIPANCQDKVYAQKFIDFLCRKDIAAKNFDYIYYSTPNKAVYDELDEEIKSIEAIFPPNEVIERCDVFNYLGTETDNYYSDLWKQIKAN